MPFRHTDFDPKLVKVLGTVWNHVCEEFSVTDEGQRQEVARQMIRAVMDGTTDPDLLAALAITWILKNRLKSTPRAEVTAKKKL